MSKVKIVVSSLFYTMLIVLFIIGILKLSISYDNKKILLVLVSLLTTFLFLKFNIISHKPSSHKRISKVFSLIALLGFIIKSYYYLPYYIFLDNFKLVLTSTLLAFFVAVNEELFFRGILYNLFYYNKIVYLLISSLVFSLLHSGHGIKGMIFAIFIALSFAIARLTKTPLWGLILAHMFVNIPGILVNNYYFTYSLDDMSLYITISLSLAIYVIIVFVLYIDTKGIWKSNFEGEKLESKSLIDYLGS